MSDEITRKQSDARPFEERVIAAINELRSDMNRRFDELDARVSRLEAKDYDTKPLWERALAEIVELRREVVNLQQNQARLEQNQEQLVQNQAALKEAVEQGFRSTNRKFDVFYPDIIDLRERMFLVEEELKVKK